MGHNRVCKIPLRIYWRHIGVISNLQIVICQILNYIRCKSVEHLEIWRGLWNTISVHLYSALYIYTVHCTRPVTWNVWVEPECWRQEYQIVYQGMLLFTMGVKSLHGICVMLCTLLDIHIELRKILQCVHVYSSFNWITKRFGIERSCLICFWWESDAKLYFSLQRVFDICAS